MSEKKTYLGQKQQLHLGLRCIRNGSFVGIGRVGMGVGVAAVYVDGVVVLLEV
jgi:hypothetical protein